MATATLLDVSSLTPNVSISHTEANDGDLDEDVNSRSSSSIVTEIEGVDGDSMSFSSPLDNASAEDWADIRSFPPLPKKKRKEK